MWGISLGSCDSTEHVEFTININDNENYIFRRLIREKRFGEVRCIDKNTYVFSADVYDTSEMIPWIRTFTGRLVTLNFSNRTVENLFKNDILDMYRIYGLEDED